MTKTPAVLPLPAIFLLLVFFPASAAALDPSSFADQLGYADKLLAERDYYGAVAEYRRLAYFRPAEAQRAGIDEKICGAYLRAGEYSRLKEYIAANRLFTPRFYYLAGLALFLEGESELSARSLEKSTASNLDPGKERLRGIVQAANYARNGKIGLGYAELGKIPNDAQEMLEVKVRMKKNLDLYAKMGRKSPGLAVGLSVVPGLGLIYAGSWAEGLGTLLAGGVSLYAGYQNVRDRDWLNVAFWSAAFLYFYAKNFVSARDKAAAYNAAADSFLLRGLDDDLNFHGLLELYTLGDIPSASLAFSSRF
jgi:hypothetical protein